MTYNKHMADFDINQHLQRTGFGQSDPKSQDAQPKNFDELIEKILNQAMAVVGKVFNVKTDSMLSTGILPQGLEKAGIQVGNTLQPIIPDAQGGFLYRGLSEGLQTATIRDFKSSGGEGGGGSGSAHIEAPHIPADFSQFVGSQGGQGSFEWKSMSYGDLGGLVPLNTGAGRERGEGMGLA